MKSLVDLHFTSEIGVNVLMFKFNRIKNFLQANKTYKSKNRKKETFYIFISLWPDLFFY